MAMNFRPHEAIVEELRLAAFISKRSANEIINDALRDWLDTKGKSIEQEYRERQAGKSVAETRADADGQWIEEWVGEPPPMGVKYRVLIDRWEDGHPNVRRIFSYELVDTPAAQEQQ